MALSPLKTRAIRLLARRDYARRELEQRLVAKGAAREELQAVLDELTAAGYLSNERYARAVVTQKTGRLSRRRIADTLKAQGVDAAAGPVRDGRRDGVARALATALRFTACRRP